MALIETPELLHERDWKENKIDDSLLDNTGRFKALLKLIKKNNPKCIFDIGCGSGILGKKIKSWKSTITIHGCDISASALERADQYLDKVWHIDLDQEDIPVDSGHYDIAVCSEVLEHIYDINHAIREINRILKPKGIGLLTVPNMGYWRYRLDILKGELPIPIDDDRHIHFFNKISFEKRLMGNKLEIISISGYRINFPWLAKWKPSLFSDTLVFEILKK
ncbi:class I SAM-dependent methyltransferase [Thermodesulfobacteriota bacterium]